MKKDDALSNKVDAFADEVRSLSNNTEFLDYLDRCRQRAKTEGTISLSEVRQRLAVMDDDAS